MQYNIHPLFVHFPIAFLFIYSVIKVLPVQRWLPSVGWRDIERVLLVVGVLGAFASLSTGEAAEHLVRAERNLVDMHAAFATAATWMYGVLLAGEVALILSTKQFISMGNATLRNGIALIVRVCCNPTIAGTLAIAGFIAIAITGVLGGVITYGVTADPIAPFVLKVLGL